MLFLVANRQYYHNVDSDTLCHAVLCAHVPCRPHLAHAQAVIPNAKKCCNKTNDIYSYRAKDARMVATISPKVAIYSPHSNCSYPFLHLYASSWFKIFGRKLHHCKPRRVRVWLSWLHLSAYMGCTPTLTIVGPCNPVVLKEYAHMYKCSLL